MTDLWNKPITADGATATPEQLAEAWQRWLQRLAEADDFEPGSLAGLVRRRLLPAHDAAARLTALLPPAQEERADG